MSIDRWMDQEDVVDIYNGILLSHKKEQNNAICSNRDGTRACHTKWSKSKRERQISYDVHLYVESKLRRKWTRMKPKQTHRHREQTCNCQRRREGRRGMDWELGVNRCKLLHIEWIGIKVLLYSTGNYSQYSVINHNKKESMYVYNWITLLYGRN